MKSSRGAHHIRRLATFAFASLALLMVAAGSIHAATIQIDGVIAGGRVQWSVGGGPATNVAVNPGDTVIWRAVSGRHGVVFDTQAAAEGALQFQTGGGLPPLGAQNVGGAMVWGTAAQNPAGLGTVLARATVKSGAAPNSQLGFFCTQHGRMMSGAIAVGEATPPPPPDDNPPPPPPDGNPTTPPPDSNPTTPPVPNKQLPAPGK